MRCIILSYYYSFDCISFKIFLPIIAVHHVSTSHFKGFMYGLMIVIEITFYDINENK